MSDEYVPQWARDEAAKRSEFKDWAEVTRYYPHSVMLRRTIRAHALTIAKHEQQPVDPDMSLAKECAIEMLSAQNEERRGDRIRRIRSGDYGKYSYSDDVVQSALIAIRKVREMGNG